MAKDLEMGYLLDFYGEVLTEKQREMLRQYYNDDLSLSEIGENFGITRQGARDAIKHGETTLKELEEKVGFAARYRRVQQKLEELEQLVIDARFECTGPSACLTTTEYADTLTKMLGIIRSIDEANEYREFDGIVLLGKYQVPGHVINEFNIDNHSSITGIEYYANRVVQAVCRTRIRMHQGLPINVYFSSDWNDDVISLAGVHLGVKGLVCPKLFISNLESDIKFMTSVLRTDLKISPKKAEQIAKLSTLDRGIYCAIVNNGIYKCTLSLDDVYSIIPMSRKEVDAYKWMKGWITK